MYWEGSSNRNASRDESVETGDESVETGDESVEAGEKHNNHVIICSKTCLATVLIRSIFAREKMHERFSASAVFPAQNRMN